MPIVSKLKSSLQQIAEKQKKCVVKVDNDETRRCCSSCGHHFVGRFCPQCGLDNLYQRLTVKSAWHSFLDIWGMGNRPMFRTLRDLFWRPGYMIGDYIDGKRGLYFPPFKMMAILVIILVLIENFVSGSSLSDIHFNSDGGVEIENTINILNKAFAWVNEHKLVYYLSLSALSVLSMWLFFSWRTKPEKHKSADKPRRLNVVETFYSEVYIGNQGLIISIIDALCFHFLKEIVPFLLVFIILIRIYSYKQLYQRSWISTSLRTLAALILNLIIFYTLLISAIIVIFVIEYTH